MKTTQINLISSFRARRTVLSDETATSKRLAFKAALAALDNQFEEIDELTLEQGRSLPATLAERDEALATMRETAIGLAGAALNYAEDQGLAALAFWVRLKPGDFDRVRMERRVPLARHLHGALESIVAKLEEYGVIPADLDHFKMIIDAAEVALSAPRGTVVDKKAATARLGTAVRNAGDRKANFQPSTSPSQMNPSRVWRIITDCIFLLAMIGVGGAASWQLLVW